MLKRSFVSGLFVSLSIIVLAFALASGGPRHARAQEPGPEGGIQATVQAIIEAYNRGDLTTLFSLTTDQGFEAIIEVSKAEALAAPSEVFGDQLVVQDIRDISVSGTTGSATVDFEAGLGIYSQEVSFVFQGGRWLIDGAQTGSAAVSSTATLVDLQLEEFAFVYDKAAVSRGDFAFNVQNVGEQDHEVLLVQVDPALAVSDLLDSLLGQSDGPPPFEDFGFLGVYEPGQSDTVALSHPLNPGKYVLLCLFPDVDEVPHALKGMVSEFTVGGAAGPITPPSTGDGGLAGGHSQQFGLMGLSTVLMLLGVASALRVVRS